MDYKKTYTEIFQSIPDYNDQSQSLIRYYHILQLIKDNKINSVIDISCGRGDLLKLLKGEDFIGLSITATDLDNFHHLDDVEFIQMDLSEPEKYNDVLQNKKFDLLCCLDVLEHIEEKYIYDILYLFSKTATFICLNIANHSSIHNNIELHLIQEDREWWEEKLDKYFIIETTFNLFNDALYCYVLKSKQSITEKTQKDE